MESGFPRYRGFTITFRHTTLGRTPLHKRTAHRIDFYLMTHDHKKRKTFMPSAGFGSRNASNQTAADPLICCYSSSPDTQPLAPHHTDNLNTKAPNTTGSNHLYNTLELPMMGIMVPETCWANNKICNKNLMLHLFDILFPHKTAVNLKLIWPCIIKQRW